jgi:hypothetical protein
MPTRKLIARIAAWSLALAIIPTALVACVTGERIQLSAAAHAFFSATA